MDNENKIKIGFLGYGTRALDALMEDPMFEVKYFFVPEMNLCQDVYDAAEKYKGTLALTTVKDNSDLAERLRKTNDVECFLMNACSIILNKEVLDAMPFYNIHPGSLETNRGHHPHLWTVLLGESFSEIVIHSVNEKIDVGDVIATETVGIPEGSDAGTVLDLLEDQIPLLLNRLFLYLKHRVPAIKSTSGGKYRRTLLPEDYRVDFENASDPNFNIDLHRKILARSMHHGAYFLHEGKRIYVDKVLEQGTIMPAASGTKVDFTGEDIVEVRASKLHYRFHINKIQPD